MTTRLSVLRRSVKRCLRLLGIEAHAYIPGSSREAQLKASIDYFRIEHVLDIGANEGQFGQELRSSGYRGRIVSAEPLSEAHSKLSDAARASPPWAVIAAAAVGSSPGTITLHVAANSVSSSALEVLEASVAAAPESRQVSSRMVPVVTVDALVAEYGIPPVGAMLKVDTQGYEWEVLDGARGTLQYFDLVLLELSLVELYAGQRLWMEMLQRMASAGFAVWFLQPEFVEPTSGRLLQINGLFYRCNSLAGKGRRE